MHGINWVQSGNINIGDNDTFVWEDQLKQSRPGLNQIPYINARIGGFYIAPHPRINYDRSVITYWSHQIFWGGKCISQTRHVRSEKLSQKNAEKLVLEYLFGYSSVILKGLKEVGLLEEALSEIGIDI